MELIQGIIQPPKVQSVEETIPILCDRLENSTLISDRRSAVLGLKSFSREYRETVIASGLKPLIAKLSSDRDDEDLVKGVLETLLILFIRGEGTDDLTRNWISHHSRLQNGKYPSPLVMKEEKEPVDQFSLWITDALTQDENLITLFFTYLDRNNFHIRLYTIQLLEAMIATRPYRTKELMMGVPTGVSTLVKLLSDINEQIRDESILLLMAVVNDNSHIQKLVAFENIFETLFSIIEDEGGLRGSLVVNDCFSLINNILRYNTSNQTLFFETGNLQYLAKLLNEPLSDTEEFFWNEQRESNFKTLLDIIALTVEEGNTVTKLHQLSFLKTNILFSILRLAFFPGIPNSIRPIVLLTAADIIRNNPEVQDQFAKIDVPFFEPVISGNMSLGNSKTVPVISLLLHWALKLNSIHAFNIRITSLELLHACLSNNPDLSQSFLESQKIQFLKSEIDIDDENNISSTNLFDVVFNYDPDLTLNPYRLFLSTEILMFLISQESENCEVRSIIRGIKSTVAETEEDNLSAIHCVSELVVTSLSSKDIRIPVSFLSFLIFLLYEDDESVTDFLSNKLLINSLLSFSSQVQNNTILRCMVITLLGIAYEFSSADSTISRDNLYSLIVNYIGVDNYASKIKQLKESELFKAAPTSYFNSPFDETGLPKIYFSVFFIELFKKNFYRIQTSLRRSPEQKPDVKITFELYDEMSRELTTLREDLLKFQNSSANEVTLLTNEISNLKDNLTSLNNTNTNTKSKFDDLTKAFNDLESVYKDNEKQLAKLQTEKNELLTLKEQNMTELESKRKEHENINSKIAQLTKKLEEANKEKTKAEDGINKMSRELFSLKKESDNLREQVKSLNKNSDMAKKDYEKKIKKSESVIMENKKELSHLHEKIQNLEKTIENLEEGKKRLNSELIELQTKFKNHDALIPKLTDKLKSLAADYKEIDIDRNNLKSKLDEENTKHFKAIEKFNSDIASITNERDALQDGLDNLKFKLEEKDKQLAEQTKEFHDIMQTKTAKINEIESLLSNTRKEYDAQSKFKESVVAELEAKNKLCMGFETSLKDTEERNLELKMKLQELQDSIIAINEELQSVLNDKTQLSKQIFELNDAKEDLLHQLQKSKSENHELEEKFNELAHLNSTQNDHNKDIIASFEEKINKFSADKEYLEDKIRKVEEDNENYRSSVLQEKESFSEKVKLLTSELSSKSDTCSLLESKVKEAETTIEDLEEKISKKEQLLVDINLERNEASEKIRTMSRELEEITEEQNSTSLKLQKCEEELATLNVTNSSLSSDLAKKIEECSALAQVKSKLETDLNLAAEEKLKLKDSIAASKLELAKKVEEFRKEREIINKESLSPIEEYSKKISNLEEILEKQRSELQQNRELFDEEKSALEIKLHQLSVSYEEKSTEAKKLEEALEKLTNMVSQKDSECTTLKNEINKLSGQVELLKEDAKKTIEDKNVELSSLKSILSTTQDAKNVIDNDFKELKQTYTNQQEVLSNKDLELKRIIEANEEKAKDLNVLNSKIAMIQNHLQNEENVTCSKETVLDLAVDRINRLENEVESKTNELSMLKKELDSQTSSSSALEFREKEATDKVLMLEKENERILSTLSELQGSFETLKKVKESSDFEYKNKIQRLEGHNAETVDEIKTLRLELSECKSKQDCRSEVDDLMILLTDLDEKNSKYKAKLLELGVELSSDEDEDSESESEDEK